MKHDTDLRKIAQLIEAARKAFEEVKESADALHEMCGCSSPACKFQRVRLAAPAANDAMEALIARLTAAEATIVVLESSDTVAALIHSMGDVKAGRVRSLDCIEGGRCKADLHEKLFAAEARERKLRTVAKETASRLTILLSRGDLGSDPGDGDEKITRAWLGRVRAALAASPEST